MLQGVAILLLSYVVIVFHSENTTRSVGARVAPCDAGKGLCSPYVWLPSGVCGKVNHKGLLNGFGKWRDLSISIELGRLCFSLSKHAEVS